MVNDAKTPRGGADSRDDALLQDLFAQARESAPMPSAELWDRVLADSYAQLPAPSRRAPAPRPLLASLAAALGGWGLVAGLTTATIAGLWIGYAHPGIVRDMGSGGAMVGVGAGATTDFDLEDFEPGLGSLLALLEDG